MSITDQVREKSLLPGDASPLELALEDAMRADIPISDIGTLWNPATCPVAVLPFLAWGLAISQWDSEWSEAQKRAAIADAIPFHRRKGTKAAVCEVLERFHPLLQLVEWHEMAPRGEPHTFEVRAPAADIPASFLTPQTAAAIIRDITATKPVRAHFTFVQNIEATAAIYLVGASRAASFARTRHSAAHDDDASWAGWLITQDGQPIQDQSGAFLQP